MPTADAAACYRRGRAQGHWQTTRLGEVSKKPVRACLKGRGLVVAGGLKYSRMGGTTSGNPSPVLQNIHVARLNVFRCAQLPA